MPEYYLKLVSFHILSNYFFINHPTIRGYTLDLLTTLLSKPYVCLKLSFKSNVVPPKGGWIQTSNLALLLQNADVREEINMWI